VKDSQKHPQSEASQSSIGLWGIQDAIADHQIKSDWVFRDVIHEVHRTVSRYEFLFKLELPPLVFGIGEIGRCTLGHFRRTHNDFGLQYEVKISQSHVLRNCNPDGWYRVLGTVLHECLHAWQLQHGKPGTPPYHNKQFQTKAADLGLIVDRRGVTTYQANSPFMEFIKSGCFNVPVLDTSIEELHPPKQKSRNYLWMCDCSKIRGCAGILATCNKCGKPFKR
jgi:hypothetical protein